MERHIILSPNSLPIIFNIFYLITNKFRRNLSHLHHKLCNMGYFFNIYSTSISRLRYRSSLIICRRNIRIYRRKMAYVFRSNIRSIHKQKTTILPYIFLKKIPNILRTSTPTIFTNSIIYNIHNYLHTIPSIPTYIQAPRKQKKSHTTSLD